MHFATSSHEVWTFSGPTSSWIRVGFFLAMLWMILNPTKGSAQDAQKPGSLYSKENLVAWCIVPFDSMKRTPAQRAEMLERMGIKKLAYDYRAEHIPTFDDEMEQLKKHGIELTAWWFPTELNDEAKIILAVLERHQLKTQLWVTGGGGPTTGEADQIARVQAEANRIRPIAEAAARIGCSVGLYNHGGWFGDPENQIAIIKKLDLPNVGIVYNLHHGHDHLDRFAELLAKMKPHLMVLNLNGMIPNGEANGKKIVPLAAGSLDRSLLEVVAESGYTGPIGILNHTDHDAEARLLDNLEGLEWLLNESRSEENYPRFRTWTEPKPAAETLRKLTQSERDSIQSLIAGAEQHGQAARGVAAFASAKSACLACHKIGAFGGSVGPELTEIGRQRTAEQLVESLLYPNKLVEEKYRVYQIVTSDGEVFRGYKVQEDAQQLTIRDPARGTEQMVAIADIERILPSPSLMPEGLAAGMTLQQQQDLVAYLIDLGRHQKVRAEIAASVLEHAQSHAPADFPFVRDPIDPSGWPSWQAYINRDRVYEYYTKEANHFRQLENPPTLLAEYPGMDAGKYGHWGNQKEETWANEAWNRTTLTSIQSGVYQGGNGVVVPRGICVQLGEPAELFACFNPETATYDALWTGKFLKFSPVRHGFMHGLIPNGQAVELPEQKKPSLPITYHGFYRSGNRVLFAYKVGEVEYLDSPWVENGKFQRIVEVRAKHPLKHLLDGSKPVMDEVIETEIRLGRDKPYAVDTIELPWKNSSQALIFVGDHDFLDDGSILICTMQGDVWRGEGVSLSTDRTKPPTANRVRWRRFASGLHQALGLKVSRDGIFVLGRDQITRLHDLNHDGEADFYECFSNAYETSTAGHDFICGLQRDNEGNFYTASGNQGIVRIGPDGKVAQAIAEGFRNPDGLGIYPDRLLTVPCSEGEWTPSSMICAVRGDFQPAEGKPLPFYGYRGARIVQRPIETPNLPMVYLPRGLDNSAGGQVYVDSQRWGPLEGQMIHLSYGTGTHFLLLRDEVEGTVQGAVVPLRGEFLSGVHRGRFNPVDGQLYVSGMGGWGTYTPEFGCLHRVRYAGGDVRLPIGIHSHSNGIAIRFPMALDKGLAEDVKQHFAQSWNYRYSPAYGSAEYSTRQYGSRGHDLVEIKASHLLDEGRTLFLEIPELQPCNQLHLQVAVAADQWVDVFATCHRFDAPRTDLPGYMAVEKTWSRHPIEMDMAMVVKRVPNPWRDKLPEAREVRIEAGKNLTYQTKAFSAKRGESIALTLDNPDVVPHNWALIKPGTLEKVGEEANRLVADPEAVIRQYAPQSDDVICYTDIVDPGQKFTIHFRVPDQPGRYPYLCTFPGHWMVMNGEMVVE